MKYIPVTVILAESEDGLLLDTVQVYSPASDIVRVWVYCAVSGSFNTVSVPSVNSTLSLVQDTVVAGPPVEIQVRVSWSESYVRSPDIVMSPTIIPLGQPTTIYLMISTSVAIYIIDKLSVQWVHPVIHQNPAYANPMTMKLEENPAYVSTHKLH